MRYKPMERFKAMSLLVAVRDLFADRSKWTSHTIARDREHNPVSAHHATAVAWCAMGAIERQSMRMGGGVVEQNRVRCAAQELLARELYGASGGGIPNANDGRDGYERIMAALDGLLGRAVVRPSARSLAASKGWVTRRALAIARRSEAESPPMVFGGTIRGTDAATPTQKEVTV